MTYMDPDVFDGIISRPAAAEIDAHLFAYITNDTIVVAVAGGAIDGVTVNKTTALVPVYAGGTTLGDALGECSIFTPTYGAVPVKVGASGVTVDHDVMVGAAGTAVDFVAGNGNVSVGRAEETVASGGEARIMMRARSQQGATTFPASLLTTNGAISVRPSASYVITKAGVLADTLAAPTATTDDGVTITVTSNTAFAHTITATGLLNTGSAAVNVATFAAFAGAGVTLQAYQGKWNVLAATGINFS